MHDLAIRPHHRLEYGLGSEGLLHEADDLVRAINDEIRRYGVVTLGNGLYFCCHGELLWFWWTYPRRMTQPASCFAELFSRSLYKV
jgi:hypothetical protein